MSNDLVPVDKKAQGLWQWADRRTWTVVILLVLAGIAMAVLPYVMPKGKMSTVPSTHVY